MFGMIYILGVGMHMINTLVDVLKEFWIMRRPERSRCGDYRGNTNGQGMKGLVSPIRVPSLRPSDK